MHYPFAARLIKAPPEYAKSGVGYNSDISKQDRDCVLKMYPQQTGSIPKPISGQASFEVQKQIPRSTQDHPELKLYHSVQPPVDADSTYRVRPQKSGNYEVIAHGNAEVLVIVEAIVAGRRSYLILDTVDSSKKISISLIADKDVEYNFTLRVLETRDSGNFCLLIGEAQQN